ncbi:MAG: riboflavin biosynthesis protein RibF, partial [Syntrophomonadaceae bacterium]|nr:riboflavin biosynthesis protein RibF [Syntrophomonadaceae bacterium]
GLDLLIYNSFNQEISKWLPEEFVEKIIISKLNAKHVFVGFNYSFGYRGQGNPELLVKLGEKYGFKVSVISPVEVDGQVVSSTLVRELIENGDIKRAQKLLGYNPMLEGTVIRGEQRGSKIGFPTANLQIAADMLIPGKGVYAAKAYYKDKIYNCVVNIGSKPTFHENHPIAVEAHIMDFDKEIYGEPLKIFFIDKIRDEKKFGSIDELVSQISQDRDRAYQIASLN